ncbi:MAG: response regulator transcription factor [Chloroflexota bacterium]|nr:response regulator transcription factor [Chloroflexota bacterium]
MDERILIIEDDEEILRGLNRLLTYEGYLVDTAITGKAGLVLANQQRPDLVVLDWMLPNLDGLEVCRRLRRLGNQPILMLTAKDTVSDLVRGLDAGADDYVVKPFENDELLARIRAILRRTAADRVKVLEFEDLKLDSCTHKAFRGDREITLTAKEYDLLELFIRHPGQVMPREIIFDRIWDYDFGGKSNVLDVYIRYLRKKLEEGGEPRLIYTTRGVGYVLRKPE